MIGLSETDVDYWVHIPCSFELFMCSNLALKMVFCTNFFRRNHIISSMVFMAKAIVIDLTYSVVWKVFSCTFSLVLNNYHAERMIVIKSNENKYLHLSTALKRFRKYESS